MVTSGVKFALDGDACLALMDWKDAGVGDPGVDLGSLKMAMHYGMHAWPYVLEGWEPTAGRSATEVAYWDATAAANASTVQHNVPGFDDEGAAGCYGRDRRTRRPSPRRRLGIALSPQHIEPGR